jgi:hypothetical protein
MFDHSSHIKNVRVDVGFELLTAMVIKCSIFWNITPRGHPKNNERLRGTCRLHFQARRMSQRKKKQHAACSKDTEIEGDLFLRNIGWFSTVYTVLYSTKEKSFISEWMLLLFRQKHIHWTSTFLVCNILILSRPKNDGVWFGWLHLLALWLQPLSVILRYMQYSAIAGLHASQFSVASVFH